MRGREGSAEGANVPTGSIGRIPTICRNESLARAARSARRGREDRSGNVGRPRLDRPSYLGLIKSCGRAAISSSGWRRHRALRTEQRTGATRRPADTAHNGFVDHLSSTPFARAVVDLQSHAPAFGCMGGDSACGQSFVPSALQYPTDRRNSKASPLAPGTLIGVRLCKRGSIIE